MTRPSLLALPRADPPSVPADPAWIDIGFPVLTLCTYEGAVAQSIIDWKEHGDLQARAWVQRCLSAAIAAVLLRAPWAAVASIPSTVRTDRERGMRPLHDAVHAVTPPGNHADGLIAIRERADQSGLSKQQRAENLHASMRWQGPAAHTALLIDDILTTGATMREAARAARAAGISDVLGVVLARRE